MREEHEPLRNGFEASEDSSEESLGSESGDTTSSCCDDYC